MGEEYKRKSEREIESYDKVSLGWRELTSMFEWVFIVVLALGVDLCV